MIEAKTACTAMHTDTLWARYESDNLVELERWIFENVREMVRSRLSICLALAQIKTNELYKQAGASTFSDYLKTQRIAIHYNTALDYASIGEVYLKHRNTLEAFRFEEYDGLRKLLLLEKGLSREELSQAEVFRKLKECSYREFRRFVQGNGKPGRPGSDCSDVRFSSSGKVVVTDECLVLMPDSKEILWFDPELELFLKSPEIIRRFKHCITQAVEHFFFEQAPPSGACPAENREEKHPAGLDG